MPKAYQCLNELIRFQVSNIGSRDPSILGGLEVSIYQTVLWRLHRVHGRRGSPNPALTPEPHGFGGGEVTVQEEQTQNESYGPVYDERTELNYASKRIHKVIRLRWKMSTVC